MSAPCDLRISSGANQIFPEDFILQAIKFGYRTVAVDQKIVNEPVTDKKAKVVINKIVQPESFRNKLQKIDGDPRIKILSRITVECSGKTIISRAMKPQFDKFDIVAGKPTDGHALEMLMEEDVDIISLDPEQRKGFHFKRELIKMALRRGIVFEINYGPCVGDATARQQTIQLAQDLLLFSKGKNVILSSGHENVQFGRGPYDVANLAVMFGLPTGVAKLTVTKNCLDVIKHSELRKSIGGTMEIELVGAPVLPNDGERGKRPANQDENRKKKKFKSKHNQHY